MGNEVNKGEIRRRKRTKCDRENKVERNWDC
jgi:hypothetical protein